MFKYVKNSLNISPKKLISIKKTKKKKVTIDDEVTSFGDGRGGIVTITKVKSYGPEDGLLFNRRMNGNMNEGLIFSREYTKAMSKDWHSEHFCCWQCDRTLTGMRYVLQEEHPFCVKCWEQIHANVCQGCTKPVGIDSRDMSYKDKHWHESCFVCHKCNVSLIQQSFGSKLDRIYCSQCFYIEFPSHCDDCGQIFTAGTKKMEYKGKQWHEMCFKCFKCRLAIGNKTFIPRENDIFCTKCFEEKYGFRCIKCSEIIGKGGITYRGEPWHRDCFVCHNCKTALVETKFHLKDDRPYCQTCFGQLFAPKCSACMKPIVGKVSGTKFMTYEDRHWHNECFKCAGCQLSLASKGFIADGQDLLCTDCVRNRIKVLEKK